MENNKKFKKKKIHHKKEILPSDKTIKLGLSLFRKSGIFLWRSKNFTISVNKENNNTYIFYIRC